MKKIFKYSLVVVVLVICSFTLVGCGKKGLVGKWEYQTGGYIYTFNDDGTGTYTIGTQEMKFTYTTSEEGETKKISITYEGNTSPLVLEYVLDGDTLNIKDSFGSDTIYKRK